MKLHLICIISLALLPARAMEQFPGNQEPNQLKFGEFDA